MLQSLGCPTDHSAPAHPAQPLAPQSCPASRRCQTACQAPGRQHEGVLCRHRRWSRGTFGHSGLCLARAGLCRLLFLAPSLKAHEARHLVPSDSSVLAPFGMAWSRVCDSKSAKVKPEEWLRFVPCCPENMRSAITAKSAQLRPPEATAHSLNRLSLPQDL